MCNKRSIEPLISHANKSRFNRALRLKMSSSYFQYLIKTPFGIFYKTDVLNQTATYREGNARHTPLSEDSKLHITQFFLTVYPVTLGNVIFRKPKIGLLMLFHFHSHFTYCSDSNVKVKKKKKSIQFTLYFQFELQLTIIFLCRLI